MNALISIFILIMVLNANAGATELSKYESLAGCWEGKFGNHTYEEQWMKPAGGAMLGMSRTIKDGKIVEFEFVQIVEREDGIFYVARPSEQSKAEFKLKSFENQTAVFEDPAHDFPQRVVYHMKSANDLVAWIEGMSKGELKKIEFPMTRAKCAGGM